MKLGYIAAIIAMTMGVVACGGGGDPTSLASESVSIAAETAAVSAEALGTVTSSAIFLSPSQVRTRYGFDGLPATPAGKGAGQLIAVISAYNNPDLSENLNTFSAKFNLPQCTVVNTTYAKLPSGYTGANIFKPNKSDGCHIQVVNVDSFGRATSIAPTSSVSSWNAESSMDIEWAHAIAPMASIIVIQAPTNFVDALGFAAKYAGDNGANVVSMSWGAIEASIQCLRRPGSTTVKYDPKCDDAVTAANYWASTARAYFSGGATFVAASGDQGKLMWPAISSSVLSVGGTVYNATYDVAWAGSGGGVSMSFLAPAWQKSVTGISNRSVPDVAYDAGTAIAVYIKPNSKTGYPDTSCVSSNGAAKCGWYGGGGTSAGTPQWAGLMAISNATRIADAKAPVNNAQSLYSIASISGDYTSAFGDITTGGTSTFTAKVGYDYVTGLGVPNAVSLVGYLTR